MTLLVYLAVYAGLLIFLAGCIRRIRQYARTPIHLRWELYPVPHEEAHRAAHGGSYFETAEWWSEPRRFSLSGELRVMLPEMLFLKGLWEFNRRLWVPSFLFHFGLYLSIATAILAAGRAMTALLAPSLVISQFTPFLIQAYRLTGYSGAALTLVGAILLLFRRITDTELRNYTKPADLFNLVFFIVTFVLLAAGYFVRPAGTANVGQFASGLVTFDTTLKISSVLGVGLVLVSALTAYIPYTHMSHFIAKYFTYHAVRWDDRPNLRGSSIESRVAMYLTYRPTWAAAHIGADGKKTWADIATTNPAEGVRK
jgi:nitrate reductase gamma subunit